MCTLAGRDTRGDFRIKNEVRGMRLWRLAVRFKDPRRICRRCRMSSKDLVVLKDYKAVGCVLNCLLLSVLCLGGVVKNIYVCNSSLC